MHIRFRKAALATAILLGFTAPAFAQLNIQFNVPGAAIGVNLGGYPALQQVPGYPVYYAPGVNQNYFFYDGMYWLYQNDSWYASSWYNGPWGMVDPYDVPPYVLRVPVRYYRHPPAYFRGWRVDAAPRWDQHWGREWGEKRAGWDRWDRREVVRPAPLPRYQREYRGDRYPDAQRQSAVQTQRYNYQPREQVSREHYDERRQQSGQGFQERRQQQQAPAAYQERRQQPAPVQQQQDRRQPPGQTSVPGNSVPRQERGGVSRDSNGQRHDAGGATIDPNHSGG